MNAVTLSLVVTAYLLPCAMFQMPAARLGDLFGRKKIYLAGVFIFSVFSLLSGLAWSAHSLLIFRVLTAVGASMMFGTAMAILVMLFPPEKRGRMLGLSGAIVYFALASGPFFGGLLAHYFGWRSIFYLCFVVGFMAMLALGLALREEWKEAEGESFDGIGAVLFALAVFGIIYGFSLLPNLQSWILLILGAVFAIAFVVYELRVKVPMFNLDLLRFNKPFRMSSIAAMINYTLTAASTFLLSLYLQYVRGLNAQEAGLLLMLQPIAQTVFSVWAGRLSDKIDPSKIATIGMAVVGVALAFLCFLSETTAWWMLAAVLVIFGIGFGAFSPSNTVMIMGSVDKKYYGSASAVTGTARLIGSSLSVGIATLSIHIYLGTASLSAAYHDEFMSSLHLTCAVSLALCVIGVWVSAQRFGKK
jgi:MFS family permease